MPIYKPKINLAVFQYNKVPISSKVVLSTLYTTQVDAVYSSHRPMWVAFSSRLELFELKQGTSGHVLTCLFSLNNLSNPLIPLLCQSFVPLHASNIVWFISFVNHQCLRISRALTIYMRFTSFPEIQQSYNQLVHRWWTRLSSNRHHFIYTSMRCFILYEIIQKQCSQLKKWNSLTTVNERILIVNKREQYAWLAKELGNTTQTEHNRGKFS